jgi:hypothetical protein
VITAHSSVDWGSAPAGVGSILTGGSLLLGFYILLRHRRNEERRQAQRLVYHKVAKVAGVRLSVSGLGMHVGVGSR